MSIPQQGGGLIERESGLAEWLAAGCKPRSAWRIGTEHEKFGFRRADLAPIPYEGPGGIKAILEGLRARFGWTGVYEGETLIGLTRGKANVSLEPGGQLELSGAPLLTIHETMAELEAHLKEVAAVAGPMGVGFAGIGASPLWSMAETPIMPKGRYGLMRRYMPTVGSKGLDMMFRTCTAQVNLDFESEPDMIRKMRVSLALQPLANALFANSPFLEGGLNGCESYRGAVWADVDAARTGIPGFVFEQGFGFERWAQYALDVPMYFVYRDGRYIDALGQSFRDFLNGALPALPGERPSFSDWADHLTTIFPDARLKRYIEMRGADVGDAAHIVAVSAFWVGLIYDAGALNETEALIRGWSVAALKDLRAAVPRQGMDAAIAGRSLWEIGADAIAISGRGLKARHASGISARDESIFLEPLWKIIFERETAAGRLIRLWRKEANMRRIFEATSF